MPRDSPRGTHRGFTFTISIIVVSVTLISMALFAQDWRRSQSDSFTGLLPTQIALTEARVSADLGAMLGINALVLANSTNVSVGLSLQVPFKKEGAPLADLGAYAASLPYSLRNTGTEAVLSANGINGSNAVVATVSGSGRLALSNGGPYDTAAYYHPDGWQPSGMFVNVTCAKSGATVSYFSTVEGVNGSGDVGYLVQYDGPDENVSRNRTTYLRNSLASLDITYPDGTDLNFLSNISDSLAQNFTSISYTKSPGALLVLPFDSNSTRDYSPLNASVSSGAGAYSPAWLPNCKIGGCYSFGGGQYIEYPSGVQMNRTANFTIAAWVRAMKAQNGGARLLYQLDTGADHGLDWHLISGNALTMYVKSTNATSLMSEDDNLTLDISDGNWHMVALSANATGFLSAYLDGAFVSGMQTSAGQMNNSQPLFIGAEDASGSNGFNGSIDEVRFYNRSISAAEAAGYFNGTYQSACSVGLSVTYNVSTASGSMLPAYNARLRIRRQLPGEALFLPFDEDVPSGEQGAITDYSPQLSGATGTNVTWIPGGRFGGAYNFSSSSSQISVPSQLLNGTGDFTLSAWMRPASLSAGAQPIMGNMGASTSGVQLWLINGPALLLEVGAQSLQSGTLALQAGNWTHVAAVRQGGQALLYVNGTLVANGSIDADAGSPGSFAIGNSYPSAAFIGSIDEPEVFDRALSPSEIASLYDDALTVSDRPLAISQG